MSNLSAARPSLEQDARAFAWCLYHPEQAVHLFQLLAAKTIQEDGVSQVIGTALAAAEAPLARAVPA